MGGAEVGVAECDSVESRERQREREAVVVD